MKIFSLLIVLIVVANTNLTAQDNSKLDNGTLIRMTEQWEPQPAVITAGDMDVMLAPPSDAIVLFDGKDISKWEHKGGQAVKWDLNNGVLSVKKGTGNIISKQNFEDFQLHIEWMIPVGMKGSSQGRGNSGVFLQGKYEVQILDNFENKTYVKGQAGSIYKQYAPLVNVCKKQGKWNTYDIIFTAPTFKDDLTLKTHARVTVLHNGVLIQNNAIILGPTEYSGLPEYKAHGKGPIILQDHSNPVAFRNIWIREL